MSAHALGVGCYGERVHTVPLWPLDLELGGRADRNGAIQLWVIFACRRQNAPRLDAMFQDDGIVANQGCVKVAESGKPSLPGTMITVWRTRIRGIEVVEVGPARTSDAPRGLRRKRSQAMGDDN